MANVQPPYLTDPEQILLYKLAQSLQVAAELAVDVNLTVPAGNNDFRLLQLYQIVQSIQALLPLIIAVTGAVLPSQVVPIVLSANLESVLPTSNPGNGQIWSNGGVLQVGS